MFERLLELFLHAKTGVIAGVFLIGTTGALVTATVENGVTTITVTQASPSPSASTQVQTSPTASPTATATATATANSALISSSTAAPAAGTTSTGCDADAKDAADEVQTVNGAFSQYHTALMQMRSDSKGDAARKIVEDADKALKTIRQAAVKAIHATFSCGKDHEDADENDQDENDNEDEDGAGRHETTTTVATTSGDAQQIADDAVAAMKTVFDTAVLELQALPSPSPKPTKRPELSPRSDNRPAGTDDHGRNGEGKGGSDRH